MAWPHHRCFHDDLLEALNNPGLHYKCDLGSFREVRSLGQLVMPQLQVATGSQRFIQLEAISASSPSIVIVS